MPLHDTTGVWFDSFPLTPTRSEPALPTQRPSPRRPRTTDVTESWAVGDTLALAVDPDRNAPDSLHAYVSARSEDFFSRDRGIGG